MEPLKPRETNDAVPEIMRESAPTAEATLDWQAEAARLRTELDACNSELENSRKAVNGLGQRFAQASQENAQLRAEIERYRKREDISHRLLEVSDLWATEQRRRQEEAAQHAGG